MSLDGAKSLKVVNLKYCSDVRAHEVFDVVIENLSDDTAVLINSVVVGKLELYAISGYAHEKGISVRATKGFGWLFVEKVKKEYAGVAAVEREDDVETKKRLLNFYGL